MQVERYLQRLGFTRPVAASADILHALQEAHLLAVPFENLDIHLGRPIILEEVRLLDKIVNQRRGGFCYELNGAFAWLLRRLGFVVTYLSARVTRPGGEFGPEYDHMALLVPVGGVRWLVDVGFGDSTRRPLAMDTTESQPDGFSVYRLVDDDPDKVLERRDGEGEGAAKWRPEFRFTLQPQELNSYTGMCRYHQSSPESSFTQSLICSQATLDGRITLTHKRFIHSTPAGKQERPVADPVEFHAMLAEWCGISLPDLVPNNFN